MQRAASCNACCYVAAEGHHAVEQSVCGTVDDVSNIALCRESRASVDAPDPGSPLTARRG